MAEAWVYVTNDGGVPKIKRTSHAGTTVTQIQLGELVVTFPLSIPGLAAVATLADSVGTITAVPGESSALSPNQVRVFTLTLDNQAGSYAFSLAVFY
jgi:hypothetical protein